MARTPRTEFERAQALHTVGYEMWMMAQASVRLDQAEATGDGIGVDAYLECALLHARSLIDFYLRGGRRDDDILRGDFAPRWKPEPKDAAKRLNDHYDMLHKYLAHLTWDRINPGSPPWDYPTIATDLLDVADAWSEHLRKTDLAMWATFRVHLFSARKTLNRPV